MTEETLPDVTAAREALAKYRGSKIKTGSGEELADALEDLLDVVDRLTAPVTDAEVEALAKVAQAAIQRDHGNTNAHYAEVEGEAVAAAIVAASGRRHLPTEPEYEYGLYEEDPHQERERPHRAYNGAHLVSDNRAHVETQWRRGHPSIKFVRRRKAGPWEVCDEQ